MASLFVVLAYSVCRCQSEQKQMILTIEMDSLVLTEGDEAEIRLRIHGITSKINSYTFRLEYEMTSKFRKQRMRKKKNIVWNPQEGDSITLSEMITECDSYHIQICSVSWEDLTGMYKVKKEFNKYLFLLCQNDMKWDLCRKRSQEEILWNKVLNTMESGNIRKEIGFQEFIGTSMLRQVDFG